MPVQSIDITQIPIVLVGTKSDLREDERTLTALSDQSLKPVSHEEGSAMSIQIGAVKYKECSAKSQTGVKDVFDSAIHAVLDKATVATDGGGGGGGCCVIA